MECTYDICIGREENLAHWMKEYSDAILQTCLYKMPDRTHAEDAMLNTLINAWRFLGNKNHKKRIFNERSWLLKIADNTCRDYSRFSDPKRAAVQEGQNRVLPKMLRIELKDMSVKLAVMDLPKKYKETVLLYYFQGASLQQIAQMLNITVTTATRRLHKAEELLRESVFEEQEESTSTQME